MQRDCATPMKGKYVTIQKYAHYSIQDTIMEIVELDIHVYCGPFGNIQGEDVKKCHVEEPANACDRKLLIVGKSKF